ncbi:MAG: FeoA family protein [Smithella sp.]|jgi:Fe2+ transport system protein FeoA|nr:iron transporter FeoA [Smithella sp. F21]MDD4862149.1 FeoA family protein [Smithellaceae bacterium]MDD5344213.1 FeoA family protein [Smithella sp.]HBJ74924.1 ferrous iron transport protein A [Syntrophaceae bacterium]
MTLADLKTGKSGIIVKINVSGALKRRLMDMGVVTGTDVIVEKVAPLGDPIEVRIKSYALSLRLGEARQIEVEEIKNHK